ncbi:MAG: adenylosuccinate synthase [Defluviitaleaceae bacterium]|nr:adenylosuccinate synthase [Defluviitaleaceae bacterium]
MLTSVVGINWGDEGKGRMVDLLSERYDVVVRYQGGNNAGHTVINERGSFVLNLLPSGILREETVNVLGLGMVIDLEHLKNEVTHLQQKGIKITPDNLKMSHKAIICLPYHAQLDVLEEERLGKSSFGSTRRGIAPVYADKYMKKALRMEDLFLAPHVLEAKLEAIVDWKNLVIEKGYAHAPINAKEMTDWLLKYGAFISAFITDTSLYLEEARTSGKKILFEAQLGALRDIDYGIYPFTSSSSTIAAYGPIGAGVPWMKLDHVMGIMKAYSSCVGAGPFTCEMEGEEAEKLREAGGEYGAATGRPRRVGGFDVVASKYGVKVQGATELTLTKLDILSYMDEIPVCVAYETKNGRTTEFPTGEWLETATPVYEYLPGFKTDISNCRSASDLPQAALDYIKYIENAVGQPIKYVSVGPERDAYFEL